MPESEPSPGSLKPTIARRDLEPVNSASQPSTQFSQSTKSSFDSTPATSQGKNGQASQNSLTSSAYSTHFSPGPKTPERISRRTFTEGHVQSLSTSPSAASPTHGSKRTASGHIKNSDLSLNSSPPSQEHSRNPSSSSPSRAKELSERLRTRLSYAMIKVHNGWESLSLSEVEQLASQATSPISPKSVATGASSPRANFTGSTNRSRDSNTAIAQPKMSHAPQYQSRGGPESWSYAAHGEASAHTGQSASLQRNVYGASNQHAPLGATTHLASPRHRRYNTAPSSRIGSQRQVVTPRPLTARSNPTPEEQEAVDTLLFMSSPANSANFRRAANDASTTSSSANASPTRSTCARQRSKSSNEFGPPIPVPRISATRDSEYGPTRNEKHFTESTITKHSHAFIPHSVDQNTQESEQPVGGRPESSGDDDDDDEASHDPGGPYALHGGSHALFAQNVPSSSNFGGVRRA